MRTRLPAILLALLLAFGAVACDDTGEGIEQDAGEIQEDAGEALDDAGEEVEGD